MKKKTLAFAAFGGALLYVATTLPASAIQCQGPNAYNSAAGGYIENSICVSRYIAAVSGYPYAGPYGVRQNPNVLAEACRRSACFDQRTRDLCAGHCIEDDGESRR